MIGVRKCNDCSFFHLSYRTISIAKQNEETFLHTAHGINFQYCCISESKGVLNKADLFIKGAPLKRKAFILGIVHG